MATALTQAAEARSGTSLAIRAPPPPPLASSKQPAVTGKPGIVSQYFVSGTHLILHPDMFDSDGPCFDVYCNSRHGWKKFCRPLSLQHCRSHLVNVHRKQTFSRNSPNFVIFISVLPCFHIESSGRSWRV